MSNCDSCLYNECPEVGWCDKIGGFIGIDFPDGKCDASLFPEEELQRMSEPYPE